MALKAAMNCHAKMREVVPKKTTLYLQVIQ